MAERKRKPTYVIPVVAMQEAFDKKLPLLLLPPDFPEGDEQNKALAVLFAGVVVHGSQDRVDIRRTEQIWP